MMKSVFSMILALTIVLSLCFAAAPGSAMAEKTSFKVAWSHYTGWEPWELADHSGILKKWADKYGIKIELTLVNDYIESINLYTGGKFDACVMTNMDALTIPAVGGIDSTALIVGDFSNGNDGIVAKNAASVAELKGRSVKLVELSVSHYLLARALSMNGMKEKDLTLVNTSDADIAAIFAAEKNGAVVTWNPPLMKVRNEPGAKLLYDSSKIPGEIIDMMVVKTNMPETFKKALVGAWYETMALMSAKSAEGKKAIQYMAKFAGGTEAEFRKQLSTTQMFYTPAEAAKFAKGAQLKKTMDYVYKFSAEKGLLQQNSKVGVQFPDGAVQPAGGNVKLRFDAKYMQMAADGKL